MPADEPIAYFITWTVYGTHLQGDEHGWRRRGHGEQLPRPRLERWRGKRLKHDILLLSREHRAAVEQACSLHGDHRGWRFWAVNARTTHVHVVVTATGCAGSTVRDQLKANSTRALREAWPEFRDRPAWTVRGDWACINTEDDLNLVCLYVSEAQDRKGDEPTSPSAAGR